MKDRETLKNYFKKGDIPSEAEFEHLIDSGINKIDDGFSKTMENGLMLSGFEDADNLISFYKDIQDEQAQWLINLKKEGTGDENDLHIKDPLEENSLLTLSKKGRIGINETNPEYDLDINGWIASKGRIGNYSSQNTVPADGQWHAITPTLDYCQAFEIIARTGVHRTGKHAIMHAITVSTYGKSRSSIRKVRRWFDFWKPVKLQLRWTGPIHAYQLELRCKQNLGTDVDIKYFITQLWSDENMGIEKQFMDVNKSKPN